MTCDLKMSLAVEAEKTIRPLAKKAAALEKELAVLVKRAASEKDDFATAEETLAQLKSAAGAYLTDGPGAFDRFKTNLKRTTAKVENLRESILIFDRELVPAARLALDAAREKLAQTFAGTVAAARSDCEARMSELLAAVVASHDEFMAAISDLGKTYSTSYHGEPPKVYSPRLGEVSHRASGGRWVTFKAAPAVAAPAATSPAAAVLTPPEAISDAPTAALREPATGDGPRAAVIAPERADDGPAPLGAAAPTSLEPMPEAACLSATVTNKQKDVAPAAPNPLDVDEDEDLDPPDLDAAAAAEADAG